MVGTCAWRVTIKKSAGVRWPTKSSTVPRSRTASRTIKETARSIWQFGTQSKKIKHKEKGLAHPAPFPLELPLRLILLYTNIGDIVLDPFMGSGSTALAAKLAQRHYLGYEISPDYIEMAEERIKLFTSAQPYIPELAPRQPVKRKRARRKPETTPPANGNGNGKH